MSLVDKAVQLACELVAPLRQHVSAQKAGEAFRLLDGLPLSVGRDLDDKSWFAFAQE